MFNNRIQSVPERFIRKQEIDRRVNECYESHIKREGNVVHVENLPQYGKDIKPLREEQTGLRISCAAFIKDQQTRGPEGLA